MLCPLDDRNIEKVKPIAEIFNEEKLAAKRILIEMEYLRELEKAGVIERMGKIGEIKINFSRLKEIEKEINHDVKAVEYYLREETGNKFLHFGICSEDVNNLAYGLMLQEGKEVLLGKIGEIREKMGGLAARSAASPMLSRTHGQPAVPTTLAKEIAVFLHRLDKETEILRDLEIEGKLNGSVGNYNALYFCYPRVDWLKFSENFVKRLGLTPNLITTQILPYDSWIRHFDCWRRINNIFLNMVTDFWWYCGFGYLRLKVIDKEAGSSSMPHKVNPIDLEAAEGNLGFANAMLQFFSDKLSKTRLQRDLSDATIRRNIGMALGYCYFAYDSILRGLSRVEPDKKRMLSDLKQRPEILAEAVACYWKKQGKENAYEKMKNLTRGNTDTSQITQEAKKIGLKIEEYTGLSKEISKLKI